MQFELRNYPNPIDHSRRMFICYPNGLSRPATPEEVYLWDRLQELELQEAPELVPQPKIDQAPPPRRRGRPRKYPIKESQSD